MSRVEGRSTAKLATIETERRNHKEFEVPNQHLQVLEQISRNQTPESFDTNVWPEASIMTASQTLGATPAGEYSWRAPSPPHIHIPPTPEDTQLLLPPYSGSLGEDENKEILKIITQGHHAGKMRDWIYDWRRQAQPILSYLYLGPFSAVRNIDALKQEGITMLLVVRDTMTAHANLLSGEKAARLLGIEAASVDVSGNPQLIAAFPHAVKMINDHLVSIYRQQNPNGRTRGVDSPLPQTTWGKVLVFCESGNERSAAVVAAYLMAMYDLDLVGAIQYIQSQRFCVAFDDALRNLLLTYQQLLEAQKSIPTVLGQVPAPSKAVVKRGRDELYDDTDMDLDHADDEARFGGRGGFVPFYDGLTG